MTLPAIGTRAFAGFYAASYFITCRECSQELWDTFLYTSPPKPVLAKYAFNLLYNLTPPRAENGIRAGFGRAPRAVARDFAN